MLIKSFCIFILLFLCEFAVSQDLVIISKVNNEIITNIDIEDEKISFAKIKFGKI